MIEKAQYYHGAAIIALLENENLSVKKKGLLGYVVNDKIFTFVKYTTKVRGPWRFTFDREDVDRCVKMLEEYDSLVIGLVCAGDGVCALSSEEMKLLIGVNPGWISVQRKHGESYGVAGSLTEIRGKIPVSRWSTIILGLI
jgi:hypothetical protein